LGREIHNFSRTAKLSCHKVKEEELEKKVTEVKHADERNRPKEINSTPFQIRLSKLLFKEVLGNNIYEVVHSFQNLLRKIPQITTDK